MTNKVNVLMCGSALSVKGGIVSVIKNYLGYDNWGNFNIIYVPTHVDKNKFLLFFYFLFAYLKIFILAAGGKIQIAHLHTAERGSFFRKAILVRTLKKFGIKVILHHHAAEFEPFYDNLSNRLKSYVNDTLEMADLNIVLSRRLVTMITGKAPKAKVKVLYNAVHTYPANPYNRNANNILFLGRLGERKGTYDLLEAIKILDCRLERNVKFYLCGDGDVDGVRARVQELGIEHRIDHIGWVDGKQKEKYIKNTMINVLPSYHEGLPMTILETMAYGIPNISTHIASIPEVVADGENGFLVETGDRYKLADRIDELVTNREERIRFSQNAYAAIVAHYSVGFHVNQVKKI